MFKKYTTLDIPKGLPFIPDYMKLEYKLVNNELLTNGGRVLNVCALGNSLEDIRNKIYQEIDKVDFDKKYYRKDIGIN